MSFSWQRIKKNRLAKRKLTQFSVSLFILATSPYTRPDRYFGRMSRWLTERVNTIMSLPSTLLMMSTLICVQMTWMNAPLYIAWSKTWAICVCSSSLYSNSNANWVVAWDLSLFEWHSDGRNKLTFRMKKSNWFEKNGQFYNGETWFWLKSRNFRGKKSDAKKLSLIPSSLSHSSSAQFYERSQLLTNRIQFKLFYQKFWITTSTKTKLSRTLWIASLFRLSFCKRFVPFCSVRWIQCE